MKSEILTMASVLTLTLHAAWPSAEEMALYKARRYGAHAKECLRVVDQNGKPVAGARIWGGIQTGDGYNDFTPISGTTDTNGEYVIHGKCTNRIRCDITKAGYYASEFLLKSYGYTHSVNSGKWQPFGTTNVVVLKAIRYPNKCHVFPNLRSCRIPEFGKWIGFDFERGEWIHPYGKGRYSDVLLKFSSTRKGFHDYKYVMDVSFTNNLFAGAYLLKADKSSKLTTVYSADSNATYRTTFSYVKEQTPGQSRHWDFLDSDSYLVFRTRTRIDDRGNLIGAHYGKILGQWLLETEFMILSDGCFNSVENDINIEDGNCLRNVLRNANKEQ